MASLFEYSHALVRPISSEFVKALSMKPPEPPVDEKLASTQHDAYVDLLRSLVTSVIEVCVFSITPALLLPGIPYLERSF